MRTLIQPEVKIKISSFEKSTSKIQEKSNNSNFILDSKFYQKIFVILLTFCIFLIFPESPKDSEALCKKYHSTKACIVW